MSEFATNAASHLPIVAAILAAGQGRRLGGVCKAMIRLQGEPMVWRLMRELQAGGVAAGVVMAGTHLPRLQAQVARRGLPLSWRILGEGSAQTQGREQSREQSDTVRAALQALMRPEMGAWQVAVLMPVDLPLIEARDIREALTRVPRQGGPAFVRPMLEGRPAHPVVCNRAGVQAVLDAGDQTDCRSYMAAHPQAVFTWGVGHDRGAFDLDTPDDLQALKARTGWTVSV